MTEQQRQRVRDFWKLSDVERDAAFKRHDGRVKRRRKGTRWHIEVDKGRAGAILDLPREYWFEPNEAGRLLGLIGFSHYTLKDIRVGVVIRLAEVAK